MTLFSSLRACVGACRDFRSGRLGGRRLDRLQLQLELHAIADQHATGLECLVPLQTEVLAVESAPRREADPFVAPGVLAAAAVLDVERDRTRDVADGQLAGQAVTLRADLLDPRTAEPDLGEMLDVEEIGRLQVLVTLGRPRVDAGGVDRRLHDRAREVALVERDVPGELGEAASNL